MLHRASRIGFVTTAAALIIAGITLIGSNAGAEVASPHLLKIPPPASAQWTVWKEHAQKGPWSSELVLYYKPVKPLHLGSKTYSRFDIWLFRYVLYHGSFPPVLIQDPNTITWVPGKAPTQAPAVGWYAPVAVRSGVFMYGWQQDYIRSKPISITQLVQAFDSAYTQVVWKQEPLWPLTRVWGIGRTYQITFGFPTSLP